MDKHRLGELKRQRQLLQEHLEWLDREIAAESPVAPRAGVPSDRWNDLQSEEEPVEQRRRNDVESTPREEVVSDVYAQLGPDLHGAVGDTRRGCLIIGGVAVAALGVMAAAVAYWY